MLLDDNVHDALNQFLDIAKIWEIDDYFSVNVGFEG